MKFLGKKVIGVEDNVCRTYIFRREPFNPRVHSWINCFELHGQKLESEMVNQ